MSLPNLLTAFRLALAPVIFVMIWHGTRACFAAALAVYLAAAATDVLDGLVARRWKQTSDIGRMMDPFVDKVLTCGAMVLLIEHTPVLPSWVVAVVISREFLVTGMRFMAEYLGIRFGSNVLGKGKNLLQTVMVASILARLAYGSDPLGIDGAIGALVWIVLTVTTVSGIQYVWKLMKALRETTTEDER